MPSARTFVRPICGKDEPHYHSMDERQRSLAAAWLYEMAHVVTQQMGQPNVWSDWRKTLTYHYPDDSPAGSIRNLRPLYAGPIEPVFWPSNHEGRCPGDNERMALHPLADINDLREVVHERGIEDSYVTPAEAVRELKTDVERLRPRVRVVTG
jgi:hypothetical protein